MKLIIIGNAGTGKTTLAKKLNLQIPSALLSLDEVAFQEGADRRQLVDTLADVKSFSAKNENWIIEGCYGDIIENILESCDALIFLNPSLKKCLDHCRTREWEPAKFASMQEQENQLKSLIEWVSSYETRTDEYGLARHRKLFDTFVGRKIELHDPDEYLNQCIATIFT